MAPFVPGTIGGFSHFWLIWWVFSLFRYPIPPLSALINPINAVFLFVSSAFYFGFLKFSDFLNENYYTFSFNIPI